MSTPKALLRALQNQVHQSQLSVDFQAFKGIYNIDDKNHKARYCYVISFYNYSFIPKMFYNISALLKSKIKMKYYY